MKSRVIEEPRAADSSPAPALGKIAAQGLSAVHGGDDGAWRETVQAPVSQPYHHEGRIIVDSVTSQPAADVPLSPALIVEDAEAMQATLRQLLLEVAGTDARVASVATLAEARAYVDAQPVALVLVDIGLPDGNGVELIAWLRTRHPQVVAVVVSAYGDEDTVLAALRAGAVGYLLKERDTAELGMALHSIQRGGAPIDPFVARRILDLLTPTKPAAAALAPPEDALSERESEVLHLVARGYSNREIAELIGLSRFTIEGYTKTIYRKLAVGSRTAAVFEAKSRGMLS